ncbi:MAG TPA: DUF2470 domain-containing protein [Rhodopila sp.]|nr:DUF2470 domain-containing protein [Rhodopila sp.]
MATEPAESAASAPPAWEARRLLRAARGGTIATISDGQPFASLVTPACMPDGALLILISRLSEHTRHLMVDAHCSIMVSGVPVGPNPQTTPRVSIIGQAVMVSDPTLKARYLRVHPYAALYADFADFSTWRIVPEGGILVSGFGRARRLKGRDLLPDAAAVAAIAAVEDRIISHCNQDHADALALIAGEPGAWQMVTADVDGFDLALGERVVRYAWSAPVSTPDDVRRELVQMTETARAPRA